MTKTISTGYKNAMSPVDVTKSLRDAVLTALRNIDLFDTLAMDGEVEKVGNTTVELGHKKTYRERFEDGLLALSQRQGWTLEQCMTIGDLRKKYPPDRIYRIRGGLHSATRGLSPLGIIVSYRPGHHGGPPEAGLAVLGFSDGQLGSAATPIGVPAEGLEDVTEVARMGALPELRGA